MKYLKNVALVGIGFVAGSAVVGRIILKNETTRKAIADALAKKIDGILYGPVENRRSKSYVSYRAYSSLRTRCGSENFVFCSREEADKILNYAKEIAVTYGFVTVADLYDLIGVTGNYTDNKYGWTNLKDTKITRTLGDQWMLSFPKATKIKIN